MAVSEEARVQRVEAARERRASRALYAVARTEFFVDQVSNDIELKMSQRVRLATELVKNKVIYNISRPVTKTVVKRTLANGKSKSSIQVSNRSKPGEFPKADTTQLMKTIFSAYDESDGMLNGYVGTPIDYGVILELRMSRPFLVRTLYEEMGPVTSILTGPIKF